LTEGDLRFEPSAALTDGADGLAAIRHIVVVAPRWLRPGGWLLLEHGYDQAPRVQECFAAAGFAASEAYRDLAGIVRVTAGRVGG
jgi:release factor glutamine methyltransferase